MSFATEFTHAICRRPGADVTGGLRAVDTGAPDPGRFAADHAVYVAALRDAGVDVTVLDPLPGFPDAVFVEDTALCLPRAAILMRPGAPSRQGEVGPMEPALAALYGEAMFRIDAPARIEGGDILVTAKEIMVGLSARTDAAGVMELAQIAEPLGHPVRVLDTPEGVLHFKTDCSLVAEETILSTPRLAAADPFPGYEIILTAEGEDAAANAIRVNSHVLMPAGFPRTAERLAASGLTVVPLPNAEAAKLDGGMSCLSLRLTPPA
ncbi:dimethylarginine dimethylaminohydrolase [Rhodobacterales bacterium HKCCE3408]|nr:dimethylarginine dimethylaminohydrolase [Rhodobacterales bacterium HKCCE3408]